MNMHIAHFACHNMGAREVKAPATTSELTESVLPLFFVLSLSVLAARAGAGHPGDNMFLENLTEAALQNSCLEGPGTLQAGPFRCMRCACCLK